MHLSTAGSLQGTIEEQLQAMEVRVLSLDFFKPLNAPVKMKSKESQWRRC